MKTKIILMALLVAAMFVGCDVPTSNPTSTLSDCNPNLNELAPHRRLISRAPQYTAQEDIGELSMEEYIELEYKHILVVTATSDKQMHIVNYDPDHTCCLTPHNSCHRNGYTITLNGWDTGLMPCSCLCPRKAECDLKNIPYGTYTFIIKHSNKELYQIDLDFTLQTDTTIVFE